MTKKKQAPRKAKTLKEVFDAEDTTDNDTCAKVTLDKLPL